jgi:phosphate transport system substrate-binding protein
MKVPPIVYIGAAALLGAGYFIFKPSAPQVSQTGPQTEITFPEETREVFENSTPAEQLVSQWDITPTTISGSTSLAGLSDFLNEFGVTYEAKSSSVALEELLLGKVTLAGMSRPLTHEEKSKGLREVAIGKDSISFVVASNSAAPENISRGDLKKILTGQVTNWSQVGGSNAPIDLVIRGQGGTSDSVQALYGISGFSPRATYMAVDSTTDLLRALTPNSIGFATATQVCNQTTVRDLLIDDLSVADTGYWPQRKVFLVSDGSPTDNDLSIIKLSTQIYQEELGAPVVCR